MGKSIFVVEGSDGSYSNRTTWLVAAFPTRTAVQTFAEMCRAEEKRVAAELLKVQDRFAVRREKAGVSYLRWQDMDEGQRAAWQRLDRQEAAAMKQVPRNACDPTEHLSSDAGYVVVEIPMLDAAAADAMLAARGMKA